VPEDAGFAAWRRFALDPPRAHGGPAGTGRIRTDAEDFLVEEQLGFEPDGGAAHFLLLVEKRHANTLYVARCLAACAALPIGDIGYAGLKDRHAVARQWFSMPSSKHGPPPDGFAGDGFRVLEVHPHSRKLRRGALAANRFRLRIRELSGDVTLLAARFATSAARGVPNYFGPQRFGREAANLLCVRDWIENGRLPRERTARGFVLSAARALAFNAVLARRVTAGCWDRLMPGDIASLEGTASVFAVQRLDEALVRRCRDGDIHPSGPLCGDGGLQPADEAAACERAALAALAPLPERLAGAGLRGERRALVVRPAQLDVEISAQELEVGFELPRGAFATSVLREALDAKLPDAEAE
jgi:tRNA pseudouridine13 synthase